MNHFTAVTPIRLMYGLIIVICLCNHWSADGKLFSGDSIPGRQAVTHHQGIFHGQKINYTAIVKETLLYGDEKTPIASIITTSYISDNAEKSRPVVFVFNGGPGASSSPLHMDAFGPFRLTYDPTAANFTLIENDYCLLDVADLVFIDPVGTGFTTIWNANKAKTYWDVRGDAQAILEIIKNWLADNQRTQSPVFLCGQSYGTIRATEIAGMSNDQQFSGMILLSPVLDRSMVATVAGNEMPYVLYLPTMSAVAWYHKKGVTGKTLEATLTESQQFAETDYASALLKGSKLSAKEKDQVATRFSQLTGLPKTFVMEKNLRISSKDFQLKLLEDRGQRIGQLDGKAVGSLNAPNRQPPYDDPSMTQRPSSKVAVGNYFKEKLKFPSAVEYITLNLQVNSQWNWTSVKERIEYWSVTPVLFNVFSRQPTFRLLVAAGCYDLATPGFATRYVLDHSGIPSNRIQYADFQTGHSIFELDDQLEKLSELVRAFVVKGD